LVYDLMLSALHIEDCYDDILTAQISFETGCRYSFYGLDAILLLNMFVHNEVVLMYFSLPLFIPIF